MVEGKLKKRTDEDPKIAAFKKVILDYKDSPLEKFENLQRNPSEVTDAIALFIFYVDPKKNVSKSFSIH